MTANTAILGIDLGTTNSMATIIIDGQAHVLSGIVPSVLSLQNDQWLVGSEALPYLITNPHTTVYSVKRLMGDTFKPQQHFAYQILPSAQGTPLVKLGDKTFSPEELSAEILKKVISLAEQNAQTKFKQAIITVPAYFNDLQRQATRHAGELAGLEVLRIINEPTAASLAYGLDAQSSGNVAVYDFGGGTFDISVLELKAPLFKVLSTFGNTKLGGDDFDTLIGEQLRHELLNKFPSFRVSENERSIIRKAAEGIKIELSSSLETEYVLSFPAQKVEFGGVFTVERLNSLIQPLVENSISNCQKALNSANLSPEDIDEVVLVGGSTRIPLIRAAVGEFFAKTPRVALDPDRVVSIGAAIQGQLLSGQRRDFVLMDVLPIALGIETMGGVFQKLISANTPIPFSISELFTTQVDNQTAVEINIYQGERELVKDCRRLGRFKLRGIPPMPAGLPKVEVTFSIDANGIMKVSALEQRSAKSAELEVVPSYDLEQHEIDAMLEESFQHAHQDFAQRQLIEFQQKATAVLRGIEKHYDQAQRLLEKDVLAAIEKQSAVVRQAMQQDNAQQLKQALDKLGELTRPLADLLISEQALEYLGNQ